VTPTIIETQAINENIDIYTDLIGLVKETTPTITAAIPAAKYVNLSDVSVLLVKPDKIHANIEEELITPIAKTAKSRIFNLVDEN
jgi:hypothetical protein